MTKIERKSRTTKQIPKPGLNQEGRQFVFRSFSNRKNIQLHFNAASSGVLPKTVKKGADALSISLFVENNPFLVNPGTESYKSENAWITYFKGTLAHNTARINLKDQVETHKPFTWPGHNKTSILEINADNQTIRAKARHDGYQKLGVTHLREIILNKSKNLIWINDTIECQKPGFYFVELPFHFHPRISVKQNNPINFQATDENEQLMYLVIDKKLKTKSIKGQLIPQILGWYSDSVNKKEPSTTIYCTALIEQTVSFQSIILIK